MNTTNQKLPIWLIILLIGLPQLSETAFSPVLPALSHFFHISREQSQATLSVYFAGFGAGVLFWGTLADRIGRRPCMLLGLLFYSMFSVTLCFCESVDTLLLVRVLQAFGASVGSVITQTMIRECFTASGERAGIFAVVSGALSFTPALGPLAGGQLMRYFSYQSVFVFLSLLGTLALGLSLLRLPETGNLTVALPPAKATWLRMLRDSFLWRCAFMIAAFNAVIFGIYSEGPFLFMEFLGMSPGEYGLFGIVVAAFSVAGAKTAHAQSRNGKTPAKILHTGLMISCVGALAFFVPALFTDQASWFTSLVFFSGTGLIFTGIVIALPCTLSESLVAYQGQLGQAGAFFSLCYYLLLSLLLELIHRFLPESRYSIPGFTLILCLLIFWSLPFKKKNYSS